MLGQLPTQPGFGSLAQTETVIPALVLAQAVLCCSPLSAQTHRERHTHTALLCVLTRALRRYSDSGRWKQQRDSGQRVKPAPGCLS